MPEETLEPTASDAEIDAFLTGGKPVARVLTGGEKLVGEQATPEEIQQYLYRTGQAKIPSDKFLLEQRFIQENQQGDIPLDTHTGLPAGIRTELSFLRDLPDQVKVLQRKYPGLVRLSKNDEPIVRVTDPDTGKQRDVLVDEHGSMTMRDFADLTGTLTELVGSWAAFRGGKAAPGLRGLTGRAGTIRDVLSSAVGAQTAGGITDAAARKAEGLDVRGDEILMHRLKSAGVDAGIDAGLLGVGKIAKGAWNIGTGRTAPLLKSQQVINRDAIAAADRINKETGLPVDLTLAEETGDPRLARVEVFAENVFPGGPIGKLRQKKEEQMRAVMRFMLGVDDAPMPTRQAVGEQGLETLGKRAETIQSGVKQAEQKTIAAATDEINTILDASSVPDRALLKRDIGAAVRTKALQMRKEFKEKDSLLYRAVEALPGGTDRIFTSKPMVAQAKILKESMPPINKRTEVIDYDQYGSPVARTIEGKEISKEFVPSDVVGRLNEIISAPDTKRSLMDLKSMRSDVSNAIAQGEAIPGVQTHYLGQIRDMLTAEMHRVTGSIPDGKLRHAWQAANDHHKLNRGKFEKIGVAELFRGAKLDDAGKLEWVGDVPGGVGDAQVVGRILGNSEQANDRYFTLKEFLGKDSGEWRTMKRAMLDDIYEASRDSLSGGTLDAGAFLKKIDGLDREIRKDLFGAGETGLRTSLSVLGVAQGKIPIEAVEKFLSSRMPSVSLLHDAMAKEAAKSKEFKKSIMQMVASGDLVEAQIKPAEFVDRFLSLASKEEAEDAMAMLAGNPALVENIQRKTLEAVFLKARRSPSANDVARGLDDDPTMMVTGKSIFTAMGRTAEERAKLKAIIGNDQYEMLADFARVGAVGAERDKLGGTAGSIAQGSVINSLLRNGFSGPLLEALVKYRIVAWAISNPSVRAWAKRPHAPDDFPAMAKAAIVSTPFLEAVAEDTMESGPAIGYLKALRRAAGMEAGTPDQQLLARDKELDDWLLQK